MKTHYPNKFPVEEGPIVGNALSAAFAIGVLMALVGVAVATIVRFLA